MGEGLPEGLGVDAHDLGPQLEPALIDATDRRVSDIRWFRTPWQRGGSATAYAKFHSGDGAGPRDVVIKMPVGPVEYRASVAMGDGNGPGPCVVEHGTEVGGWDFGWMVMERVVGEPASRSLCRESIEHLFRCAAMFSKRAAASMPPRPPRAEWDWEDLLDKARHAVRDNHLAHEGEWIDRIKHLQRGLSRVLAVWNARPQTGWCHGDLHPGNLMFRSEGSPWGDACAVLLDFAECHVGHWVEDAVYVERQFWAKPDLLFGVKPVSMLAKLRREAELETDGDYAELAAVRRVLMGAVAPAFIEREGHPAYLEAALGVVSKTLPTLVK
jgi:hypothetical protein